MDLLHPACLLEKSNFDNFAVRIYKLNLVTTIVNNTIKRKTK